MDWYQEEAKQLTADEARELFADIVKTFQKESKKLSQDAITMNGEAFYLPRFFPFVRVFLDRFRNPRGQPDCFSLVSVQKFNEIIKLLKTLLS